MEKKQKLISSFIILLIAFLILIPSKVFAESYEYTLNSYDINIIVNENNTMQITEKIGAYFNINKHGIFRKIPLRNTVTRLDGTISKNRAKISDISVNDDYSLYNENGYKVIKIGNANYTIRGQKNYTISYLYNLGKDTGKEYDELYFNLIGDEWDTSISNITFTITMPKEFDKSKLGFSSGRTGSTESSNVFFQVNGNVITGRLNRTLNPGEALTVRLELPEGYFVGASNNLDLMMIASIILPIVFVIISYLIWRKYGKDDPVVETVEFYPPDGLNSLEVGFLYKGKAQNKDVTSLLVYLANKGYLQICDSKIALSSEKVKLSEDSKESVSKKIIELQNKINEELANNPSSPKIKYYKNMLDIYKNIDTPIDYEQYGLKSAVNKLKQKYNFIIRKIKDYDGADMNEQWFMEGLFENGRTEVTDKMLYNSFYLTNNSILYNVNKKGNKDKVFERTSSNKKKFIILMMIVTYLMIALPPLYNYGEAGMIALLCPAIGFIVFVSLVFKKTPIIIKFFGILWGLGFGGSTWLMGFLPAFIEEPIYLLIYIIGFLCILIMYFCFKYLEKRTKYGTEMLGKLRGFKNFLETAEKDKLEMMVMENPNYFYDILPYTYVLGVSDKWIEKFESISLESPSWYDGSTNFDVKSFGSFMNTTMTYAQRTMTSVPSSGSSGGGFSGSSGGGSSGGGSGGGGGGSW